MQEGRVSNVQLLGLQYGHIGTYFILPLSPCLVGANFLLVVRATCLCGLSLRHPTTIAVSATSSGNGLDLFNVFTILNYSALKLLVCMYKYLPFFFYFLAVYQFTNGIIIVECIFSS